MRLSPIILLLFCINCTSEKTKSTTDSAARIEGLWIERSKDEILKFYGDTVINNIVYVSNVGIKIRYNIVRDSIMWIGLNPKYNRGKSIKSERFEIKNDSLHIWNKGGERVYFKVNGNTYHDYFLKRGEVALNLPVANNISSVSAIGNLDIKIGFKDREIIIYIDDVETVKDQIGESIARFKRDLDEQLGGYDTRTTCRFFVDGNVPCEYTLGLFKYLRTNDIRRVAFITETESENLYLDNFSGLTIAISKEEVNLIEEKR